MASMQSRGRREAKKRMLGQKGGEARAWDRILRLRRGARQSQLAWTSEDVLDHFFSFRCGELRARRQAKTVFKQPIGVLAADDPKVLEDRLLMHGLPKWAGLNPLREEGFPHSLAIGCTFARVEAEDREPTA